MPNYVKTTEIDQEKLILALAVDHLRTLQAFTTSALAGFPSIKASIALCFPV